MIQPKMTTHRIMWGMEYWGLRGLIGFWWSLMTTRICQGSVEMKKVGGTNPDIFWRDEGYSDFEWDEDEMKMKEFSRGESSEGELVATYIHKIWRLREWNEGEKWKISEQDYLDLWLLVWAVVRDLGMREVNLMVLEQLLVIQLQGWFSREIEEIGWSGCCLCSESYRKRNKTVKRS
jgi:hypothetical protein